MDKDPSLHENSEPAAKTAVDGVLAHTAPSPGMPTTSPETHTAGVPSVDEIIRRSHLRSKIRVRQRTATEDFFAKEPSATDTPTSPAITRKPSPLPAGHDAIADLSNIRFTLSPDAPSTEEIIQRMASDSLQRFINTKHAARRKELRLDAAKQLRTPSLLHDIEAHLLTEESTDTGSNKEAARNVIAKIRGMYNGQANDAAEPPSYEAESHDFRQMFTDYQNSRNLQSDLTFHTAVHHFSKMAKAVSGETGFEIPPRLAPFIMDALAEEHQRNKHNSFLKQSTLGVTTAMYGEITDIGTLPPELLTIKFSRLSEGESGYTDNAILRRDQPFALRKEEARAVRFITDSERTARQTAAIRPLPKARSRFTTEAKAKAPDSAVPPLESHTDSSPARHYRTVPEVSRSEPVTTPIEIIKLAVTVPVAPPEVSSPAADAGDFGNPARRRNGAVPATTPSLSPPSSLHEESPRVIAARQYLSDLRYKVVSDPSAAHFISIVTGNIPPDVIKGENIEHKIDQYKLQGKVTDPRLKQSLARVYVMSELAHSTVPHILEQSIIDVLNHEMSVNAANPKLDQYNRSSTTALYGTSTEGKFHVLKKTSPDASFTRGL